MYCLIVITSITSLFLNVFHCEAHILSKRIVGGEPISITKVPWMAMLTEKEGGDHYCGGTIISKTAVLTSAQCLFHRTPADVIVVIGVTKKDEIKEGNRFSVKSFIPHPDYNSTNFQNDVAILILEKGIDVTKYSPISLPAPEKQTYNNACIAGWGYTSDSGFESNELREACFTSNDFKDCSQNWSNVANPKIQMCVGSKGKDSCFGDAGGPLYTEVNGKVTEIGIVSFGKTCGDTDSVYTRVSEFVQWIQDIISNI